MSPSRFKYQRAFLAFIAILLIFLIVSDMVIVSNQRKQLLSEAHIHMRNELDLIGTFVREPLLKHDYAKVERFLIQWAEEHGNVAEVSAVMHNNFMLAEYKRAMPPRQVYFLEKQVRYGGMDLINLKVGKDLSAIESILSGLQAQLIAFSIFLTAILGTLLWLTFRTMALKPLEKEITLRSQAEEMLQKSTGQLEVMVRERTDELKETNRSLLMEIAGRKKAEQHIRASLREKEVLLKEIHHRVKNNMQIITSLLRLQAGKSADEKEIEMLRESRNRIMSMAIIHEKLYRTSDLAHINFKDYIHDLTKGLYRSYGADTKKIAFNIESDDILLEVDTAIPCGLIVNELVSNALKYAFPGDRRGTINVRLRRIPESEESKILELTVSDNGIGMPKDFDFRNAGSLGLKLVATLSENQLNGKIEAADSEGASFRIRFKEKKDETELSMEVTPPSPLGNITPPNPLLA